VNPLFSFNALGDLELTDFEKKLIDVMVRDQCMMSEALHTLFESYEVDTKSVFALVDFLEEMVHDLDKVQMMMAIYTDKIPDFHLRNSSYNEKPPTKDDES